ECRATESLDLDLRPPRQTAVWCEARPSCQLTKHKQLLCNQAQASTKAHGNLRSHTPAVVLCFSIKKPGARSPVALLDLPRGCPNSDACMDERPKTEKEAESFHDCWAQLTTLATRRKPRFLFIVCFYRPVYCGRLSVCQHKERGTCIQLLACFGARAGTTSREDFSTHSSCSRVVLVSSTRIQQIPTLFH
ncbi:unnamed protein product, partial [Ectocarpus sp. 4 AP-2014]